jgi:lysophospholipase L1-like esterase
MTKEKRILFIGDSLIEFFDWERRFSDHIVSNQGRAGETVDGLFSRLNRVRNDHKQPDSIFIMTGINNLAMGDRDFISTYKRVLERIREIWPNARIYVHSLLPVLFPMISNDEIIEVNGKLKKIAEEEEDVEYINIHTTFLDGEKRPIAAYLLDDGVHVSDEGYKAWSAVVEKIVQQ